MRMPNRKIIPTVYPKRLPIRRLRPLEVASSRRLVDAIMSLQRDERITSNPGWRRVQSIFAPMKARDADAIFWRHKERPLRRITLTKSP